MYFLMNGFKEKVMANKNVDENINYLFQTILNIETMEECEALFDDLCTKMELASISQRLVVAKMLSEKKVYSDIVAETGASTATISRVARSINEGYKMVFERLKQENE